MGKPRATQWGNRGRKGRYDRLSRQATVSHARQNSRPPDDGDDEEDPPESPEDRARREDEELDDI